MMVARMDKVKRLILNELKNHPGYQYDGRARSGHHYITYPGGRFCVQSTPRNATHAVQVLRKQIRQIKRGTHRCR